MTNQIITAFKAHLKTTKVAPEVYKYLCSNKDLSVDDLQEFIFNEVEDQDVSDELMEKLDSFNEVTDSGSEVLSPDDSVSNSSKTSSSSKTKSKNQLALEAFVEEYPDHGCQELMKGTNYRSIVKSVKDYLKEQGENDMAEKLRVLAQGKAPSATGSASAKSKYRIEKVPEDTETDFEFNDEWKHFGETKITSEALRARFGEPLDNTVDEPDVYDWRFCYKFTINDKLYVIYDKIDDDDEFDDLDCIEWYADGEGSLRVLNAAFK